MLVASVALVAGGCGGSGGGRSRADVVGRVEPRVVVPKGAPPRRLVVRDLIEGSGPEAQAGDELTVEYIGVFYNGKKFTNSWERAKPFKFRLGDESAFVDPSWEKGLVGMRLDGRRELIVPPAARGAPPGTPPEDTIVYVIDLVEVD